MNLTHAIQAAKILLEGGPLDLTKAEWEEVYKELK